MIYPQSIYEIKAIIKEARKTNKTISIAGKMMSQGKQVISNNDWNFVINTLKLNQIKIDPDKKIAKVGAGVSWSDLQKEANRYGLAVQVMQASNIFSIGGSISANCHGWDYKTGCLRNTLLEMTVVDAHGNVLVITPDDILFDYIVGGYGSFGIIVDATLSLTENVEMIEKGIEISPADYVAYFNQNIRNNKDVDMHLYRLSLNPKHFFLTGIAVNYERVNNKRVIADLKDEPIRGSRIDRIKLHSIRRLSWLRELAWGMEKKDALLKKNSSRNELMRPPINPIFNNSNIDTEWLQEYFVKGEDLPEFLNFLSKVLKKNKVNLLNASVRFVKHDPKTKLSYAKEGDQFATVIFFNQKLTPVEIQKTKTWVREIIDYLIVHEGTYYLPYQHFATAEQFKNCYPNVESIITYKKLIDSENLFNNGFYSDYLTIENFQDSPFRKVFKSQRKNIRDFLNNIFMQLNEKEFFILVDSILENPELSDEQIYEILYSKIGQAKSNKVSNLKQALHSLKSLKDDLGAQTASLLAQKKINGYVEIGYPGRMIRPLKDRLTLKGPFYVISDQERFTDYIEAGFPRPYNHFIPLDDYAPIPKNAVADESVDLVCMYIGLHHAPKEKIEPFLSSIRRILRPGGTFILMDHDAHTIELKNLVDVVHSIFNAATGIKPQINNQEIRNFQSLQYWIDYVASNGLLYNKQDPLIRKGDSTLNSLISFNKPLTDPFLSPDCQRPQLQTCLTAPEWQNVRSAQRFADFIENEPAYRFPYFSEIGGFWKVYAQSWKAAQEKNGFYNVAVSDYNLMNLFIGSTMTLEYSAKGLIAAPFSLWDKMSSSTDVSRFNIHKMFVPTDQERIRSLKDYGKFIENTPFYKYHYFGDIGAYWKLYKEENKCFKSRIKGFFVGVGMTLDYALKGIISAPLSYFYGSEVLKEAETTHLFVHDPENFVETIDQNIAILNTYPEQHIKHIEVPRYMHFTEIMLKIAKHSSLSCINIAGHDKIQVDVKGRNRKLKVYEGARKIYEIPAPTDLENTYSALEVDVDHLCEVIRNLESDDLTICFIHDF